MKRPGLFFTLDGVVRKMRPEVTQRYVETYSMAPPVPTAKEEQEIIEPVVNYMVRHCEQTKAIPIGIDMAPYLQSGQISEEQYLAVRDELTGILQEMGLPKPVWYLCPHQPTPVPIHNPVTGQLERHEFQATCPCRFPQPELIHRACVEQNIFTQIYQDKLRIAPPSVMIGNSQDEREAAIMKCGLNFIWVEGILDGSIYWNEQTTHEHLKMAREMQKFAKEQGHHKVDAKHVEKLVDGMLPSSMKPDHKS
jgi:histidinol phosphatase-like enzyme